MLRKEAKLGFLFGILSNIFGGLQPVIARSRPIELDPYLFSGMTAIIQMLIFIPVFIFETYLTNRRLKLNTSNKNGVDISKSKLYFGHSKWILFIIIGIMFSLVMFMYYTGLDLAGAINGTLAQKSTAFFGIFFGFLLLKEKITKIQVIFSFVLFFGLILAVTQGKFYLLEVNMGVLIIIGCSAIWMFGHTCSKPYLENKLIISSELVVWRNMFTGVILLLTYPFIFGIEKLNLIFDPLNAFYYIIGGALYGLNVFCWYQIIKYLDINMGTILITPQLIITAFFGYIILGEPFTIYHLLGLIIILSPFISKKTSFSI